MWFSNQTCLFYFGLESKFNGMYVLSKRKQTSADTAIWIYNNIEHNTKQTL